MAFLIASVNKLLSHFKCLVYFVQMPLIAAPEISPSRNSREAVYRFGAYFFVSFWRSKKKNKKLWGINLFYKP